MQPSIARRAKDGPTLGNPTIPIDKLMAFILLDLRPLVYSIGVLLMEPNPYMKICVLGSRGETEISGARHRRHSGILIDDKILCDLGEKSFLRLKPQAILITHLHPDHAYFILKGKRLPKSKIYAPEAFDVVTKVIPPLKKIKVGAYSITSIPTVHSKKVKSTAYLVETKTRRLLYTGDVVWIEKKYWKLFGKLDLVITEGSYFRKGGLVLKNKQGQVYGHTGIPNLVNLFAPFTRKILLVHFGSWFLKDIRGAEQKIKSLASRDLKLIAGYDGLVLTI